MQGGGRPVEPPCAVPDFVLRVCGAENSGLLRRRLIESGEFYIVPSKYHGVGALRVTIINPLTTPDHLDRLMEALRHHGRELLRD